MHSLDRSNLTEGYLKFVVNKSNLLIAYIYTSF